jgi:hypothetical protein
MSNNSENKETDILNIWEKAGNTLNDQQQLNKEIMESLINKTSTEFSSGLRRLLKADAIFKVVLISGFAGVAAFNLANLFVLAIVLICIIIGTWTIKQERLLIEGLNDLQEHQGNIRDFIENDIRFYKRNIFRYPFVLSMSVFLFYLFGSLVYHGIRYDIIKPIEDVRDGIVLLSFLILSVVFSFTIYYPFFRSRITYLQKLLDDIDNTGLISNHIDRQKVKKRKHIILTSFLILAGALILIALIIAYF